MSATFSGGAALEEALRKKVQELSEGKLLRVGFLETARYPQGGPSVAQVAFWNEYGTKTAPPRAFFRNLIASKKNSWGDDLGKILVAAGYDVDLALDRMGMRMDEQLRESITTTNAPPLAPLTVMIRKLKQGRTDAPTTIQDVREASRRLAAGESTSGVNAKPLVYSNVMRSSVAHDIEGGE